MTEAELYRTVVKAVKYAYPQHRWMRLEQALVYLDIKSPNTFYSKAKLVGAKKRNFDGTVLWDMNEFDEYLDDHKEELV